MNRFVAQFILCSCLFDVVSASSLVVSPDAKNTPKKSKVVVLKYGKEDHLSSEDCSIYTGGKHKGFSLDMSKVSDLRTKIKTKDEVEHKVRTKYSFGLSPRVMYSINGAFKGFISFGAVLSKYKIQEGNKLTPSKKTMLLGFGLEHRTGKLFIRGEFDKVYSKTISKTEDSKLKNSSYVFRIGSGYRF